MTHSIHALQTKLNWQLNQQMEQLQQIRDDIGLVQKALNQLENQTLPLCDNLLINPDLEMNRLSFNLKQQQEKDELRNQLKEQYQLENQIQTRVQRSKTELKMLEKYLTKQKQVRINSTNIAQEQCIEEWSLQKKDYL